MKNKILHLLIIIFLAGAYPTHAQIISTIAGDSAAGYNGDNIPAVSAELHDPNDIAFDGAGNIYIADGMNNRIRKINTSGIITTFAGTGTGGYNGDDIQATAAELNYPSSITFDASGNLYITDDYNNRIRKINTSGIITTIAGTGTYGFSGDNGMATLAKITSCIGIAVDGNGNVYFTDIDNYRIRRINNIGIITTIAGTGTPTHSGDNGPATDAALYYPVGLAIDSTGNIYFAEHEGCCIRKISAGIITTIVGTGTAGYMGDSGPATAAELYYPFGVSIDNMGNLYIPDVSNNVIRMVNTSEIISTIIGTGTLGFSGDGGMPLLAEINAPSSVKVDGAGSIYIADWGNDRIRYIKSTLFVNAINKSANNIQLYPNPSNGVFTINFYSAIKETVQVFITNAAGEKIKELNAMTNNPIEMQLDIPNGVYFLSAASADERWYGEVIVNR